LSSNARFFISPHNTYMLALKISGFTLHRPPEDNSTKELVSQRFWTTCIDFCVLQAIQEFTRTKIHIGNAESSRDQLFGAIVFR
jgi:hypothetical protein